MKKALWIIKNQHTYSIPLVVMKWFVLSGSSSCTGDSSQERTVHFSQEYILWKTVQKYKEYILSLFDQISSKIIATVPSQRRWWIAGLNTGVLHHLINIINRLLSCRHLTSLPSAVISLHLVSRPAAWHLAKGLYLPRRRAVTKERRIMLVI